MRYGDSSEGDRGSQGVDPRVAALASELVTASGNFGLRTDKLDKADTLLGLRAVREKASREGLTSAEAAMRHVCEMVDSWPEERGRAILRAALGFDHGTERGRAHRLDLLVLELSTSSPRREKVTADSLDTLFTRRLVFDLATAMFVEGRSIRGNRLLWVLGGAAVSLLLGLGIFLVPRDGIQSDEPDPKLVFRPVPQRCLTQVCNSEAAAIEAQTKNFTPGGLVSVAIFTPDGQNANDVAGVYAYHDELQVNAKGAFTWRYWWDPGMKIGYTVYE